MASSRKGSPRAATPSPVPAPSPSSRPPLHTSSGSRSASPILSTSNRFGGLKVTASPASDSPGASPQLTPAGKITAEGFGSLFCHVVLTDKKEFQKKALMGKEIPVERLALFKEASAFDKKEKELHIALEDWLNSLENVSTSDLMNDRPRSAIKRNNSGESMSDTSEKVTEVSQRSLFTNYAKSLEGTDMPLKRDAYPKDPRGCLVTVSSRQDTACLNMKTRILFQGVCKNADKYFQMDGIRQCAGYLYHQLWWFRTVQGVDIEKVYGFVVCGPKCKDVDEEKLVVSLLVLSAPEHKIGAPLKLFEYREAFQKYDTSLFCTLGNFVQKDWRDEVKFTSIPAVRCFPGCMMIPSSLLFEVCSVWQIVPSGTAALVIRLALKNKNKALDFVDKFDTTEQGMEQLKDFVTSESESKTETIYLKVKTYASGAYWDQSGLQQAFLMYSFLNDDKKEKVQTWRSAYPQRHLPVLSSKNNVIVLMNDMGCQLSQTQKPDSYPKFCREYLSMMQETLKLQELLQLVHGDIHQGNLLYKEAAPAKYCKLCLIDWDESSLWKPVKRTVVTKTQKVRYPEELRVLESPEAYTKAQLLLLFRDISESHFKMNVHIVKGEIRSTEERVNEKLSVTEETAAKTLYESLEAFLKETGEAINA